MPKGFFSESLLIGAAPDATLPRCGACNLFKSCQTPKMVVSGKGLRKILIVGESPSKLDDEKGSHFRGSSGSLLKEALTAAGVDMREDCWLTNAIICSPNKAFPTPQQVSYCRPNLLRTIKELQPVVIILLGTAAVSSLIADLWKDKPGPIDRWVGWQIPAQKINAWVCPTYHPRFIQKMEDEVLSYHFSEHIRQACEHTKRPWNPVPNWENEIEVILDTDEAARVIDDFERQGGVCAFDYENNCLKPETDGGAILCASACLDGKRTIAYPWHGRAIVSTGKLLHSKNCSFIASNLKHEDRWTRFEFGRPVRRWAWDTMIAAHTIDNRKGICSLKFQSFVLLGMPSYNDHIERFLAPLKGKKLNQAKQEIDLRQLLKYCGFDTLLEYFVAEEQVDMLRRRKLEDV